MAGNTARRRNIFVLGLDDFHLQDLERIPDRDQFNFHRLLECRQLVKQQNYDIDALLDEAEQILRRFDEPIDAIIGYWDFPVTSMVPILCDKFGLPAPSLEAVLRCAHKYWCRLEQQRYIPEATPAFCAVNPFSDNPFETVDLAYPFWIKPVQSYGSMLGFRIDNRHDFDEAIEIARGKIRRTGDPFNKVLAKVDTSPLNGVDGNHMIAEAFVGGIELAPEGYVQHGRVEVHGLIDMVQGPNGKSFHAYRYPSVYSRDIQDKTIEATRRLLSGIGYDNGCFNVEYFWDAQTDQLRIIEVNTRVSQSHSNLMAKVDGMSNYEVAVHVGLGDEPHFVTGGGPHGIAAKFLYRRYDPHDARCVSAPDESALARLAEAQPDTIVTLLVKEGMWLNELETQDPYSWVLAELLIGGADLDDLNRRYQEAIDMLPFEFDAPDADDARRESAVHA